MKRVIDYYKSDTGIEYIIGNRYKIKPQDEVLIGVLEKLTERVWRGNTYITGEFAIEGVKEWWYLSLTREDCRVIEPV